MPGKFSTPHSRLRLAGVIVLLVGLLAALCVHISAADSPDTKVGGYRIVNGHAYAVPFDSSSGEEQQLERLGGKAAVWTYRFDRWLASLWHGERLACTLAALSAITMLACFHVAGLMAVDPDA
ncbi:hypothetical protein [Variovorax sp. PBL-E5]|uniref:hypothetical protein n=1 Tax=Variovorax sp. PBL-E5 TaxID=434014 RepID=UPI0013192748|nr:hypothetical protein [Variovorax sp. PBL-E5]VTU25779.1 hypothetical protein E5CHR_02065 [Variovorax sp. PBL-E5]